MNVCPLFLVAKPGQPDQWRCIAEKNKGHQNQPCAADPVHMTCPEDILPRVYPGGLSPVIDASKIFHMFLNVDEDRKFMGIIRPDTGELMVHPFVHGFIKFPGSIWQVWGGFPPPYLSGSGRYTGRGVNQ
jgi:hypothetical protein